MELMAGDLTSLQQTLVAWACIKLALWISIDSRASKA